ncbi:MAG: hypothetical protein K5765_00400 [Clostridia bacterium]|nr:hypothetical protein [Clostridia bacterium]
MNESRLFSDKICSFLNKIPTAVWIIIGYIALVCSQLYFSFIYAEYYSDYIIEQYNQVNIALNPSMVNAIFIIFHMLLTYIIFEIVIAVFHIISKNTLLLFMNSKDFKTRCRYIFFICNMLIALLQIGYFFTIKNASGYIGVPHFFGAKYYEGDYVNPYAIIQGSILDYAIYFLGILILYKEFSKKMPPKNRHKLFYSYTITFAAYVTLELLVSLINTYIRQDTKVSTYAIIAFCLQGGLIALFGLFIFFAGRKIAKDNKDKDDGIFGLHDDKQEKKEEYIFDEYKF